MISFLDKYVQELYNRQNIGALEEQKNLYSLRDYYIICSPVIDVLRKNPDASIQELRDILYRESQMEKTIRDYFLTRQVVPGAVFSYGTNNYRETIVVGNREEISLTNGVITPSIDKMSEDTIFDLASITKVFTSLCIMRLVELNILSLSSDVSKLDERFSNLKGVSIYDLLSFNVPLKTDKRVDSVDNKDDGFEILKSIRIDHDSNNLHPYTDMGIMVLRYVIEKVTGLSYYDVLSKLILSEYGMTDTHALVPKYKINRVASNNFDSKIIPNGEIITNTSNIRGMVYDKKAQVMGQQLGLLSGHAGLFSSAKDMTTLLRKIMNGQVLTERDLIEFGKNRQGKAYNDDNGEKKYVQYLGYMTYSKYPIKKHTEVFYGLSGQSFAGAGWTGTQFTLDPINQLYFFLGSNRAHNRLTFVDPKEEGKLIIKNGNRGVIMPDGTFKTDTRDFAYTRADTIINPSLKLLLQYKMLEDITNYHREKIEENIITIR